MDSIEYREQLEARCAAADDDSDRMLCEAPGRSTESAAHEGGSGFTDRRESDETAPEAPEDTPDAAAGAESAVVEQAARIIQGRSAWMAARALQDAGLLHRPSPYLDAAEARAHRAEDALRFIRDRASSVDFITADAWNVADRALTAADRTSDTPLSDTTKEDTDA